jgi:prepilin-type processing-associated H-X9-DG protein
MYVWTNQGGPILFESVPAPARRVNDCCAAQIRLFACSFGRVQSWHGDGPSDDHGGTGNKSTMAHYVAIVGTETMWPDGGTTDPRKVSDGTSMTFLVVEVANSGIHWMEPRDLHVIQMAPTINAKSGEGISSPHTGGAQVLFADGHVQFITDNLSAADLRALLTAHAGDTPADF